MKARILALILVLVLAGQLPVLSDGIYDSYKQSAGDKRWHTKLNQFIDAVSTSVGSLTTSLATIYNLITTWAPTENQDILIPVAATYVDADTFTLPGDYTAQFAANARVRVDLGSGVLKGSYVASSSYGGGVTTVNIHDAVLTNPIGGVWVTATRNGLFPYGPGYVVARDYGAPGRQALADAISAIGANNRTLIGTPGAWAIDSDLTVPANVQFEPQNGFDLQVATGVTVTFNGPVSAGLCKWITCTGTGKVAFGPGSVEELIPEWWTKNTTPGTTDMTTALTAAYIAADGRPINLLNNNYLITDIFITNTQAVKRHYFRGKRPERGCNGFYGQTPRWLTTITFTPVDTTKYLIEQYTLGAPGGQSLGPFIWENINFELGDTNGFKYGDPATTPGSQYHIVGVQFINCNVNATTANPASDANGVITRSGRYMVRLTQAFEANFTNVSLYGGDTQISLLGCDKPTLRNIRSQYSHVPIEDIGIGSYVAQGGIDNLECEGWTFTPVRSNGCGLAVSNSKFEANIGTPAGHGIWAILNGGVAVTVNVTAGDNTLTFSQSMDNVLFPNLSIIRLWNGAISGAGVENTYVLVKTVSGATVTVYATYAASLDADCTKITWSNAAANVQRIHGGGPSHWSDFDASYINCQFGVYLNCPSVVYVARQGSMNIANGTVAKGSGSVSFGLVIGNRVAVTSYLNGRLNFANCSPLLVGDANHPLVSVDNWGQNRQGASYLNARGKAPFLYEETAKIRRVWTFTPKDSISASNNSHRTTFVQLDGDKYQDDLLATQEKVWAWNVQAGDTIILNDESLPTRVGWFRIIYKVRAISPTAPTALTITAYGDGSTTILSTTIMNDWQVIEQVVATPANWRTSGSNARGFRVTSTGCYVAGIMVEELVGRDAQHLSLGLSAAPATGTWKQGQISWRVATSGQPAGDVCLASGTFSAATDPDGDTTNTSATINGMTDTSDFNVGEYVTVSAGFPAGIFQIISKTATSLTLDTAATSAQANVTVETPNPTFGVLPNL